MTIEILNEAYPKLYERLPDDISKLRYLLVIDIDYDDEGSDEFDAIDPECIAHRVLGTLEEMVA